MTEWELIDWDDPADADDRVMSWWAQYRGMILTALVVTLILVASYVAVRRGWLP